MAWGTVNTPGGAGDEEQLNAKIQAASDAAKAAQETADGAQSTAEAALAAANKAQSDATSAQGTADEALETAQGAATLAATANRTANTAAETANLAKSTAQEAVTAAGNAQTSADAALQAVTKLTSIINAVPSQSGSLTYTGSAQSPTWNGYDAEKLSIGGDYSAVDAGTYTATFTPKIGYTWDDGTRDARSVTWKINRATLAVPTQKGSLTYSGSAQSPQLNNYDSAKMTLGGTTSGTNAGSYNATVTPNKNHQWSDGGTGAKTVAWSIGKAAGSLSLNKTSMSLNVTTKTGTVAVTRAGDGAITASSSNTATATVSVSGTTVTVTGKATGNVTVTINVAAGTNHTAPSSKTVSVTVSMPSGTLANNGAAEIKAAAQSGQAANLWSVGDKIGIKVNGTVGSLAINDTYYAIILGFNHNASVEGSNSIHFQFGKNSAGKDIAFVDGSYNSSGSSAAFRMNTTNTNSGGWNGSYMRKTICPQFLNALPADWRSAIVSCTKYSDNTGGGNNTASYVTATQDKIWLLAEFEAFGTRYYANSAEQNYQKQYDYYKNGNSRVRYKHNDTGTACYWWLRSVRATGTAYFGLVDTDGGRGSDGAYCSRGFAPGFKVA